MYVCIGVDRSRETIIKMNEDSGLDCHIDWGFILIKLPFLRGEDCEEVGLLVGRLAGLGGDG